MQGDRMGLSRKKALRKILGCKNRNKIRNRRIRKISSVGNNIKSKNIEVFKVKLSQVG